jgi:pSer/pThr/pTyr-binding forkhead associated (FHA) protein
MQAGSEWIVRDFPFVIGRAPISQIRLGDQGVWDRHLEIRFQRDEGFTFSTRPGALVLINEQPSESGLLRNGDWIQLGSVQLRFWLASSERRSARAREFLTWTALAMLFAAQISLIYLLLR